MHWTVKADLRDPALDTVATRLTQDQLIRQVLQGRGEAQLEGTFERVMYKSPHNRAYRRSNPTVSG